MSTMSTIFQKSISLFTMTKTGKMTTMLYSLYNIVLIVGVVGFSDETRARSRAAPAALTDVGTKFAFLRPRDAPTRRHQGKT